MKKQVLFFFFSLVCITQLLLAQNSGLPYVTINNRSYAIADFGKLMTDSDKFRLKDQGISILEYLDGTRYLVVSNSAFISLQSDASIQLNTLRKSERLSEELYLREFCNDREEQSITLQYLPLVETDYLISKCRDLGVEVKSIYEHYRLIYVTCNKEKFEQLANEDWVQYAACTPEKGEPEDREGRSLHRVNLVKDPNRPGVNLDGEGVRVLVRDDGPVGPHIDFHKRLNNQTFGNDGTHGDGVAGIIGGSANIDPLMEGMAPRCSVYVVNYQDDFLDNTLNLYQKDDVVITNSSYSNGCNVGYTYITQIVDKQINENPSLLHCFSAGNSNNADCNYGAGNQWGNVTGGHKIGKNVITAANLTIAGTIDNSSSRGPTKDRRLKPDVAARGTNQNSTNPDNTYQVFGGTSAASPGVAGTAALLYQAYKSANAGVNPRSALIKSILMNTASDLGPQGPDYVYGFGVIDGYRAHKLLTEKRYQELIVKNGENLEIELDVPANSAVAKFMIYWSEKEASLNARKVLINDIDLEVISPSGNTVLPWVPNPTPDSSILAAGPRPGIDTLNNFEQVAIQFPEAGKYKIIIKGKFLPDINVPCYLLYDFPENKLEITSPSAGDLYSTLEATNIYYRSYQPDTIKIELSTDGGNSWRNIKSVLGTTRLTTWNIPNNINSDSCIVRLTQAGNQSQSEFFTISNPITGLKIDKFCPDEISLTWSVSSKDSFIIYSLQGQSMKEVARSNTNAVSIPISSRIDPLWFAVAGYRAGVLGRRTKSINIPDTLVKCIVANDISIKPKQDWISVRDFVSCDKFDYAYPEVWVTNRNVNEVKEFEIQYKIGSNIQIEKVTKILKYRDSVLVKLSKGIPLDFNGILTIPIWTILSTDEYEYNDTTRVDIINNLVEDTKGVYPMIEGFDAGQIPDSWIVQNRLPVNSWSFSDQVDITGSMSKVISFSNINYSFANQQLNLITRVVDLSTSIEPYYYMDYAYHKSTTFPALYDTLLLEVLDLCTGQSSSRVLFSGAEQNLYTTTVGMLENWIPTSATMWRNIGIDLSVYKGKKIAIKLNLIRGVFSNLYVDNIKVIEKLATTPTLSLTWTPKDACVNTNVRFTGSSDPSGSVLSWNFGNSAVPRTFVGTSTNIRFTSAGKKTIVLTSQQTGKVTISTKELNVYIIPQASFDFALLSQNQVRFTNFSTQIQNVTWDFGDGSTSTELNPVHDFTELKPYSVTLTVSNACGSNKITRVVDLTPVGVSIIEESNKIKVLPNPSTGIFHLTSDDIIHSIQIMDLQGRIITSMVPGVKNYKLDITGQPQGAYLMKVRSLDNEYNVRLVLLEK